MADEEVAKELKKMQEKSESKVLFLNHLISVALAVFLLVIGLPVWWKATETKRVGLPYPEIEMLSQAKLPFNFTIDVMNFDPDLKDETTKQLSSLLETALAKRFATSSKISLETNVVVDSFASRIKDLRTMQSSSELSERFPDRFKNNRNVFGVHIFLGKQNSFPEWYISEDNNQGLFIESSGTVGEIAERIINEIDRKYLGVSNALNSLEQKADQHLLGTYKSSPTFDITLTLAVCNPEKAKVEWNAEEAVTQYLDPMIAPLRNYLTVNVASQNLYYMDLQTGIVTPGKTNLNREKLSRVTNQIESRLYSFVSNNPQIHLVVYIPCDPENPISIEDENGNKVESNSFVAPRWGGVIFYDRFTKGAQTTVIDNNVVMPIFGHQILQLLGFDISVEKNNAIAEPALQKWLFWRSTENIATARSTLVSLVELLDKVRNMVISDEIAFQVLLLNCAFRTFHKLL